MAFRFPRLSNAGADAPADPSVRLNTLAKRAGAALAWERAWPRLAPLVGLAALFLIVSWGGLWTESPRWGRIGGLCLFGLGLAAALWRLAGFRLPSRTQKLARLDRDSGLAHRPATTIDDSLANASADPETALLWELHVRRARTAIDRLRVALPSPRLAEHDRFALRSVALVGLVAAAFVAGPEKYARVLAAFDWTTAGPISKGFRLDAWVDPPPYTGRPPIILGGREEANTPKDKSQRISAPVGSTIVVRSSDGASVTIETVGALEAPKAEDQAAAQKAAQTAKPTVAGEAGDHENRWTLRGDAKLVIRRLGAVVGAYDLASIPDQPPTIALKGEPQPNVRGSLTLAYTIGDDYGVIGAEAEFARPVINGKPVTGRSLVEPPRMPLALPTGTGGIGDAQTTADLAEHAWAGARVTMTLTAHDEGGNVGRSEPREMTLPQRIFVKPVAKALVEQRRNLVLAPDDRARIVAAMEGMMIAPERFKTDAGIYLGLNTILSRLKNADRPLREMNFRRRSSEHDVRSEADLRKVAQDKTDDNLRDTADFMWEMALRIEDGNLSDAERDLRQAQQDLRDALQRGASEEEIKKLMENLRAAMDKFLRQLAEQMQRDRNADQQAAQPFDPDRFITSQDLQNMLKQMEDMAKSGNMAEAQRLLDQLQNMMENLQSAQRRSAQQDQAAREMNRQLGELDKLTREQQQLRDKTFRQGQQGQQDRQAQRNRQRGQQGQRQPRQPGDPQAGEQGDDDNDQMAENGEGGDDEQNLEEQQQNLRQRLQELQRRMKQLGMKGEPSFDEAEDAMRDAEQQLGTGQQGRGKAVDAQGRALEALRKGAQSLAQQMQQQPGNQPGGQAGPGYPPDGPMRQGQAGNPDPLGRESHDRGSNSRTLYDPPGLPAAQRAQRVLEELRRRLSDPSRPREETDYLERLLKPY